MNGTDQEKRVRRILFAIQRYVSFFLLVGFVVTCCMLLFLSSMQQAMNLQLTNDNIRQAARSTFFNVLLLTTLFTVIDGLRRRVMIERPVRQIVKAAERIMSGDFTARIPLFHNVDRMGGLNDIAVCINRMAEELSGMETLRTDFIANVSHELKTPLAVIQNYAVMMERDGIEDETRREYAGAIAEASRRLAGLITNILKLNRLENQQIFPDIQTYDLGEQLCECLLGFENAWEKKELDIRTDIQEEVMVRCDAELLTLVWNNLFSNAIKFTDAGGCVSLTLRTEEDMAVVEVSDTGCGFGKEVGQHIFEKFYQGDASHAEQGNGLGLALVKRVVDITGGDISVSSEVGVGSTFTVRIRRKRNEEG